MMVAASVERLERAEPLPEPMQGRWVSVDGSAELIIEVGKITCYGVQVEYDYKEISRIDGALSVDLRINDNAQEDSFQRANITGLVITPEGRFFVYNVRLGDEFIRPHP